MSIRTARLLTAGTLIGALALAGCSSGDGDGEKGAESSASSADAGSGAPADGGSTAEDGSAAAAGVDAANPPKALASLTLPGVPSERLKTLKADLVRLERDGKVVKAVVGLTPTFDSPSTSEISLYAALGDTGPDTKLIDPVNLKLYRMFDDGPGSRLEADVVDTTLVADQTSYYWAVLAAPPEDVDKVNVAFGHGADMFMGVPIS